MNASGQTGQMSRLVNQTNLPLHFAWAMAYNRTLFG